MDILGALENEDDVIIVDNDSSYEPLLDFYSSTSRKVIKLGENIGQFSPWVKELIPKNIRYAVTDPDVLPMQDCPSDFIEVLESICKDNPELVKAGLGLRIDNIPDHFSSKQEVIDWEGQFWGNGWGEPYVNTKGIQIHCAPVDTTFAVYNPNTQPHIWPARRTGYPYLAQHTPWYIDSQNISDEEKYYRNNLKTHINNWNK